VDIKWTNITATLMHLQRGALFMVSMVTNSRWPN